MSDPTLQSGLATEMDKPETGKVKEGQDGVSSRVIFDRVSPPNAFSAASLSAANDSAALAKVRQEPTVS